MINVKWRDVPKYIDMFKNLPGNYYFKVISSSVVYAEIYLYHQKLIAGPSCEYDYETFEVDYNQWETICKQVKNKHVKRKNKTR